MPHNRSLTAMERRTARRRALREAYWDRQAKESIFQSNKEVAVTLNAIIGEVLYDLRGYVSPTIASPELTQPTRRVETQT